MGKSNFFGLWTELCGREILLDSLGGVPCTFSSSIMLPGLDELPGPSAWRRRGVARSSKSALIIVKLLD